MDFILSKDKNYPFTNGYKRVQIVTSGCKCLITESGFGAVIHLLRQRLIRSLIQNPIFNLSAPMQTKKQKQ